MKLDKQHYRNLLEQLMTKAEQSDNCDYREILIAGFVKDAVTSLAFDDPTASEELIQTVIRMCQSLQNL